MKRFPGFEELFGTGVPSSVVGHNRLISSVADCEERRVIVSGRRAKEKEKSRLTLGSSENSGGNLHHVLLDRQSPLSNLEKLRVAEDTSPLKDSSRTSGRLGRTKAKRESQLVQARMSGRGGNIDRTRSSRRDLDHSSGLIRGEPRRRDGVILEDRAEFEGNEVPLSV